MQSMPSDFSGFYCRNSKGRVLVNRECQFCLNTTDPKEASLTKTHLSFLHGLLREEAQEGRWGRRAQSSEEIWLRPCSDRKIKMIDFTRLNLTLAPDPSRTRSIASGIRSGVCSDCSGKISTFLWFCDLSLTGKIPLCFARPPRLAALHRVEEIFSGWQWDSVFTHKQKHSKTKPVD